MNIQPSTNSKLHLHLLASVSKRWPLRMTVFWKQVQGAYPASWSILSGGAAFPDVQLQKNFKITKSVRITQRR